jgi:hypothetical protein
MLGLLKVLAGHLLLRPYWPELGFALAIAVVLYTFKS